MLQKHPYFHPESEDSTTAIIQINKALEKIRNDQINIIQKFDLLQESINKKALYLKDVNVKVYAMLRHLEKVLMRTVMDQTDVTVPTTIIISPQKITSQMKVDGSYKAKQVEINQDIEFVNSLSNFSKGGSQEVYLYLIDEFTKKPVIPDTNDDIYPIPIRVNLEDNLLNSISSYLTVGLKFVVPASSLESSTQSLIELISVIEEVSNLSDKVTTLPSIDFTGKTDDDDDANDSTQIAALKEFFVKNDPNGTFCQLRKVTAVRSGHYMWTTEENFRQIESETDDDISTVDLYNDKEDGKFHEIDNGSDHLKTISLVNQTDFGCQTDVSIFSERFEKMESKMDNGILNSTDLYRQSIAQPVTVIDSNPDPLVQVPIKKAVDLNLQKKVRPIHHNLY